jgi:hypothetical protein
MTAPLPTTVLRFNPTTANRSWYRPQTAKPNPARQRLLRKMEHRCPGRSSRRSCGRSTTCSTVARPSKASTAALPVSGSLTLCYCMEGCVGDCAND